MLSRIIIFLGLVLCGFATYGQRDLIITQAGKEIRCKILQESSMRFSYAYINEKGAVSKTEIFKTLISSFKYDYYPEDVLPNEKLFQAQKITKIEEKQESKSTKKSDKRSKSEELAKNKELNQKETNTIVESKKPDKVPSPVPVESKKGKPEVSDRNVTNNGKNKGSKRIEIEKVEESDSTLLQPDAKVAEEIKPVEELPTEKPKKEPKSEFKNYLKYRIGIKGGLANILSDNTDKTDYGLYQEKLNRGWVYGVDASYFLNDYIGLGVVFNSFQARNKNSWFNFPRAVGGDWRNGSLENKVAHRYVGPMILGRIPLDFKTFITATAGGGYYFYSDRRTEDELSYHIKGKTMGVATTLGLDFLIGDDEFGRDIILSFECGYNYGKLKKVNYGDSIGEQTLPNPIDLSRLDFTIGIRFTRFPRYFR